MSNEKLTFDGECFLWDGYQVAFITSGKSVCLSLSNEDLRNAECPTSVRKEIQANRYNIVEAIVKQGYIIEEV